MILPQSQEVIGGLQEPAQTADQPDLQWVSDRRRGGSTRSGRGAGRIHEGTHRPSLASSAAQHVPSPASFNGAFC